MSTRFHHHTFFFLALFFFVFSNESFSVVSPSSERNSEQSNASISPVDPSFADDSLFYNQVVRMKDGKILVGRVQYDAETDRYTIKAKDGSIQSVLHRDVLLIEEYSRTFLPPIYNPTAPIYPCDERQRELQWYFAEVRLWGMFTGKDESKYQIGLNTFTIGGEVIPGFRIGKQWGVGLGVGFFRRNEINRIPLFLHGRYQLSLRCLAPFLYAQAGTVFDNQSGDRIALNKIFHPGPKIAGFGIGIDYPVLPWLDVSADIGYRYLQLPTKTPCDCGNNDPAATAIFYNESHGFLLRLGVTF